MEDNNKLFVFDKKEVVLIFIFIVIISAISFTMGVRLGKEIAVEKAGFTKEDKEAVDLKSNTEEYSDKIINEAKTEETPATEANTTTTDEAKPSTGDENLDRLKQEFAELEKKEFHSKTETPKNEVPNQAEPEAKPEDKSQSVSLKGKLTIQLGAYDKEQDARDFAEGFSIRGYEPIVNEVQIAGKGTWYRVSIGVFGNIQEAKDYINKEKSLFQGQDYIIKEFK